MGTHAGRAKSPRFRWLGRCVAVAAWWAVAFAPTAGFAAQASRRDKPEVRRSPPPAGAWDGVTAKTFRADAFSTLVGPRPDFAPGAAPRANADGGGPGTPAPDPVGLKWSTLISEDTLTDEVKEMKSVLAAACAKQTDFKGGGFKRANVAFSSLALAFSVIADYDHDVRWKKTAATARDLFAKTGFDCEVGDDRSFKESRARLEDLEALLDGDTPQGTPDRRGDFRWSWVAGRPALMLRLEQAQQVSLPAIASRADFGRNLDALRHAVEIVAVIGEAIQRPDYDFHDDDSYRDHAAAMRDAAVEARTACEKDDYDAARAAVGRIEKACTSCHGDYRGN